MVKCDLCNLEFSSQKELTKHLVEFHSFNLWNIYEYYIFEFDINKELTCPICGNRFHLTKRQRDDLKKGKEKCVGCSSFCSRALVHIIHGSPLSKKEIRDKIKKTNLEKYGTESALSNKEIRDKIAKTNLEKYGTENIGSVKEVQEKIKETNLERYGVRSTLSLDSVKDKIAKTNLERYGAENIGSSKEIRDKIKKTNLEKYGVECALKNKGVKENLKKTCLEKYGVENPMQNKEVQKKFRVTCLNKFGTKSPLENEDIKEKIKNTCLERYGNEYAINSEEIKERIKKTNLEKYGVEAPLQSQDIRDKIRSTNKERYEVDYFCQHEKCYSENGKRVSKINRDFYEMLLEHKIESELEFIIDNYGYDIRVDNTLIEINPYYTHNSTVGPVFYNGGRENPKPFDYHKNKTEIANKNGYSCVHLFDWDDWNKAVSFLSKKETIYARKCDIKRLEIEEVNSFLQKYHFQGISRGVKYAYGLFYKNDLVQVMTFGKPRYNKNYEWELLRLCSHANYNVSGGASKLLSCFEKEIKPLSIISYCDLSKFSGNVYENLGFLKKKVSRPAKHWYNHKTKRHITDNLLRQRGFDQLHNTSYGKGTSNEELMLAFGYVEIFDCGQATYAKEYLN